jgi:hypothetical protein
VSDVVFLNKQGSIQTSDNHVFNFQSKERFLFGKFFLHQPGDQMVARAQQFARKNPGQLLEKYCKNT